MKHGYLLGLSLALASVAVQASEFDFNLSDESANASVTLVPAARSVDFGAGYLYQKGGVHVANVDFHARGRTALGNLPATVGVGVQLNIFDEDPVEGGGVGVGGYTHLKIPNVPGLGVNLSAHFAPSITSFGDADNLFRWDAKLTYRVIQNADIYAGYRQVKTNLEHGPTITINEGPLLGFIMYF